MKLSINAKIEGDLDIFYLNKENQVLIHGNKKGLISFANLLTEIANIDQEKIDNTILPVGAREHIHLIPSVNISKSSNEVIVGRLDAKGTGNYYKRYIPK